MTQTKKGLFYGWYVVAACTIVLGGSVGLLWNCMSVFVKPVTDALGFSRGAFTLFTTIVSLSSTIVMPFYGPLFAKFGQKRVMYACAVVACLMPFAMSLSTQLWQFYIIGVLQGSFVVGLDVMAVGTIINNWFRAKKGLATGIAYSGSSLGGMVAVPVVSLIVENQGWQMGYVAMTIAAIALIFPMLIFVIKERPEDKGLTRYGEEQFEGTAAVEMGGLTRAEAIKSPMFWILGASLFITGMLTTGIATNFLAFMDDGGFAAVFTSGIVAAYMAIMSVAKLGYGTLFDKFGTGLASLIAGLANLIAPLTLVFIAMPGVPYVFAFFFGMAYATQTVPPALMTSAIFGNKHFTSIYGVILMFIMAGASIGAPFCGFIFDLTGSYNLAWIIFVIAGALCTVGYVTACKMGEARKTW